MSMGTCECNVTNVFMNWAIGHDRNSNGYSSIYATHGNKTHSYHINDEPPFIQYSCSVWRRLQQHSWRSTSFSIFLPVLFEWLVSLCFIRFQGGSRTGLVYGVNDEQAI